MQVLIIPLARQPLTEEEFYDLGVETPRVWFAARLCRLLNRLNPRKAVAGKSLEVENVSQISVLVDCDFDSNRMSPAHR